MGPFSQRGISLELALSTLGQEKKTLFVQGNNNMRVRIWRDKQTKKTPENKRKAAKYQRLEARHRESRDGMKFEFKIRWIREILCSWAHLP